MNKKILTLLLAATMVFSACGENKDSSEASMPSDGSTSTKRDYNFSEVYKKQEDSIYTIQFEPIADSNCNIILGMDILEGYDADWLPETTNTENSYIKYEADDKKYATATFYTAPNNPAEFYGTDDKEKILDSMVSTYFPVLDIHDGLLKSARDDFGYEIITDWTGKFGDYDYFLIEFFDQEKNTHCIRFRVGNSKIDETYWLYSLKVDVPADNQQLIDDYRAMLFSLKEWH